MTPRTINHRPDGSALSPITLEFLHALAKGGDLLTQRGMLHPLLAPAGDGRTDEALVDVRAIHVRGVQQRHPQVQGAVDSA